MAGSLSKTRFSIYVDNPKKRKQIISSLKNVGGGGGNYYVMFESRLKNCEHQKNGLTIFDLPNEMNSAKYRNTRLPNQKADLANCANQYLRVRGKFNVQTCQVQSKQFSKFSKFKLGIGPDLIWETAQDKIAVAFYMGKLDSTRLTRLKADYICSLIQSGLSSGSNVNRSLVIDLENGHFFECEQDGAILMPSIQGHCNSIDSQL